jgi:hypothetical protein
VGHVAYQNQDVGGVGRQMNPLLPTHKLHIAFAAPNQDLNDSSWSIIRT